MVSPVRKETAEYTPSFNMQAGKCQNTVTQQEVPLNILPDPKSEVSKLQEVFADGGYKGLGATTIGMTGE